MVKVNRRRVARVLMIGALLSLMVLAEGCAHWWPRRGHRHPKRARVIRAHR